MEAFGKMCFAVLLIVVGSIISGFTFMLMWKWFVSSTFGLHPISIAQSIGLMLLMGYLKPKGKSEDEGTPMQQMMKTFYHGILFSVISLIFGFVVFQFI